MADRVNRATVQRMLKKACATGSECDCGATGEQLESLVDPGADSRVKANCAHVRLK